ncbi:MAG: molybdopterin-guanine dinucleotide biosynthesis protein B [Geminicoccaceae bacterium]|nr:MAG: molybdopterin-guanine dinucleotide biosynthesis protein B [Geminicoccaceae bacterium]
MRVFGIVGWKNSGKTTLTERLVAHLSAEGVTVSTIKHTHHDVDLDQPGKDSWRHRRAGAVETLLATPTRTMLIHERRAAPEPPLDTLLARLQPVDLVLVEGFKYHPHPKLEVSRRAIGRPLIARTEPSIVALATDYLPDGTDLPRFELDQVAAIARFILARGRG